MGLVYVAVAGLGDARCGGSCGRATGRRTSATRPGRRSRCCSSAPWTAARSVSGRPRRPAAPGEPLGRPHDGPRRGRGRRRPRAGAGGPADRGRGSGSTSSARPGPGRRRPPCSRRGPAPRSTAATRAVRARTRPRSTPPASASRRATIRRTSAASGRPARLAVTKALTAIDPGNAELAAARAAGIPLEAWQQVVADAAAGRRLVGIAGTHGKSTSAGWLVHVLASAGLDPGAFVGALLPAALTGFGVPATARRGAGDAFVVEADEYAGNFDAYRPGRHRADVRRVGPPRRVRGPGGGAGRVRGVDPARGATADGAAPPPVLVANVGDDGRRRARRAARRLARADRRDRAGRRGAAADRRLRPRDRRPVPQRERARRGAPRPDHGDRARRRPPSRSRASTRSPARSRCGCRRRAATTPRTPWASPAPRPPLGVGAGDDRRGPGRVRRASAGGSSARARPGASWSTTTTATTRRRSARRSPRSASASRAGASGRSTSR